MVKGSEKHSMPYSLVLNGSLPIINNQCLCFNHKFIKASDHTFHIGLDNHLNNLGVVFKKDRSCFVESVESGSYGETIGICAGDIL